MAQPTRLTDDRRAQMIGVRPRVFQPLGHRVALRLGPTVNHDACGLAFGVRIDDANATSWSWGGTSPFLLDTLTAMLLEERDE